MTETGYDPDPDDPARFLERIRKRSGLMIERARNRFAFTHLSFQEYFAAVYLQEWVTSAEWLTGEEVAPGTSADDLRRYGNQTVWQVALIFLFELTADGRPLGKKKVREAVFGGSWEALGSENENRANSAELLARLVVDPHVNWDAVTQTAAFDRCVDLFAGLGWDQPSPHRILDVFRRGEQGHVTERFRKVVSRWSDRRVERLDFSQSSLGDLNLLSNLTHITHLDFGYTSISDLRPLKNLIGLKVLCLLDSAVTDIRLLANFSLLEDLDISGTRVTDLAPLAALARLECLSVDADLIPQLRELSGLPNLKQLTLMNYRVTPEDVQPLRLKWPHAEIQP